MSLDMTFPAAPGLLSPLAFIADAVDSRIPAAASTSSSNFEVPTAKRSSSARPVIMTLFVARSKQSCC